MTKQRSILFVNRVLPPQPGATGRVLWELADHLVRAGWRVGIVSAVPDGKPSPYTFKNEAITHYTVKHQGDARSIMDAFWLHMKVARRVSKAPAHDIVVSMTDPPMLAWTIGKIAQKKESKHVIWAHDLYPDLLPVIGSSLPNWGLRMLERLSRHTMRNADKVIAIGNCMANHIKKKGVRRDNIRLIQNWANTALYKKQEVSHTDASSDETQKFRILYAGNLGAAHAKGSLIAAIRYFDQKHPEIEFSFLGGKDQFQSVLAAKSKYHLDNIRFVPFQPESKLAPVLRNADLHLISMKDTALGKLVPCKFYSALAVGRPMIFLGPKPCEVARVIDRYECGLQVSPSEGKALIKAILKYRNDGDAWFSAQTNAEKAGKAYHPAKAFKKWETVLNSL